MAEHEPSIGLSSDWLTPLSIFRALGLIFDLDAAHPPPGELCFVPCHKFYTKADDGLRQPWHGLVWLNPPFGGRRVYRRIERLYPGPYLELFARKPRDGWTTWGDELPPPRPPR
jgi:hypothetical protein